MNREMRGDFDSSRTNPGPQSFRQALVFPFEEAPSKMPRPYRVLLELPNGRLVWCRIELRSHPGEALIDQLAAAFGAADDPYSDGGLREANERIGMTAALIEAPVLDFSSWDVAGATARTLARLATTSAAHRVDRAELAAETERRLGGELSRFCANLESACVKCAAMVGALSPRLYNFLFGHDPVTRRNRMQAAEAFPLLVPYLLADDAARPLILAIDQGKPLVNALVARFGVRPSVIRCLGGNTVRTVGERWQLRPATLTMLLSDLPPEKRPGKDAASWRSFNEAVAYIESVSRKPVTSTLNRLWLRAVARAGFRFVDFPHPGSQQAELLQDMIARLNEVLVYQARRPQAGVELEILACRTSEELLSAHSVTRLLDIARRWRDAYLKAVTDFADERDLLMGEVWPSPLPEPFTYRGLTCVPLLSPVDLQDEGDAMHNCVATYCLRCLTGAAQLFSLRDSQGQRRATLETCMVATNNGSVRFAIVQLAGRRNRAPDAACAQAAQALLEALHSLPAASLASYLAWKRDIAQVAKHERSILAAMRPVIAAFDVALPPGWKLERLQSLVQEKLAAAAKSRTP